ncbi:MAG: hypothetical protein A2X36_04870 [Elusimicrobia bacterium GWA2_69_24]|nr:MAG: hypothetical protein A2X36_04870 [Elusimicrobia bacterium GWA2_69_24]HBL17494.1 hypothetical protein [Elusimicrobiota bacterium]
MRAAVFSIILAAGWAFGQKDAEPGKLTPIDWRQKKTAVEPADPRAKEKTVSPDPSTKWICSKDVYPVQVADPSANMKTGNPVMGVRRCWKEGDPAHWVEKPFNMMDPMQEAVQAATRGLPAATGGRNSRFLPMIKPKAMPKKKAAKADAVLRSTAAAAGH